MFWDFFIITRIYVSIYWVQIIEIKWSILCKMHMVIYIRDLPEIFQWTKMICQVQMLEIIECLNNKMPKVMLHAKGKCVDYNNRNMEIGSCWYISWDSVMTAETISILVNFYADNHFRITRLTSSTAHWQQHFNQSETMPWICCS